MLSTVVISMPLYSWHCQKLAIRPNSSLTLSQNAKSEGSQVKMWGKSMSTIFHAVQFMIYSGSSWLSSSWSTLAHLDCPVHDLLWLILTVQSMIYSGSSWLSSSSSTLAHIDCPVHDLHWLILIVQLMIYSGSYWLSSPCVGPWLLRTSHSR